MTGDLGASSPSGAWRGHERVPPRQAGRGGITLDVPEHAEDFADGETGYALVLPEEGSDTAGERLSGTIRLTVNTLEVVPGNR